MASVNIRDLKANLSAHLQAVRAGQELTILDRNLPIARIIPFDPADEPESEEMELVAAGVLRMPTESLPADFWDFVSSEISPEDLIRAVSEDRDEAENRLLGQ